ncbi:MAG: 2-hydroxyacid dehydrogenase [Saprospiraceae bacterium]|nr:2-hydroxyacid dehydrogenase [Saprospiraceae bacterium]
MKVAFYSLHKFEKDFFLRAAHSKHELKFIDAPLSRDTVQLATGCRGACIFVNDDGSASILHDLKQIGLEFLVLRSSGFNHVDLKAAAKLGIRIARVPEYSPHAIAEHSLALMLTLNRKLIRAHQRIMDLNFSLDGLVGFDMNGKTVGIIGTGKIGRVAAKILNGFGCRILAYDVVENEELKRTCSVTYTDLETLYKQADIISLHVPLSEKTKYMINSSAIKLMKSGVMLINTSRGLLVNTKDVIDALKTGHIGSLGLDVYEEEEGLFFEDHSDDILQDDTIARLLSFRNVLITSHQAFLTDTALINIADTTIQNLDCFENKEPCKNEILI